MREERKIWLKNPESFNDWRRKNDLPEFLKFVKAVLPHFDEWQQHFGVTDEIFLRSNQTSEFFVGYGLHSFYRYFNPWHWDKTHEICSSRAESFLKTKEWADNNNRKISGTDKFEYELYTEFVPYFDWLMTAKKILQFEVQSDYGTSAIVDDFRYNHWTGDAQRSISAELFGRYKALNLGQETISGHLIRGKNLDFTNLDGLEIRGRRVASTTYSKIRYASCREIALVDLDMAFLEFERCHFSDVHIINCDMQDLHFIKVEGGIRRIYDSRLTHLIFDECCPIRTYTDINRGNMPDFKFINHNKLKNEDKHHFHNKMRKAAQDFGYSHQAQENYFLERKYRMLFNTSLYNTPECRNLCDHEMLLRIRNNGLRIDKTLRYFFRRLLREIKAFGKWKILCAYLSARVKNPASRPSLRLGLERRACLAIRDRTV